MEYKPHDYQQFAINYILEHPIAAVILGMGLGKTSITLTAIEQLIYDSFEVSKVLVVAPLRLPVYKSRSLARHPHQLLRRAEFSVAQTAPPNRESLSLTLQPRRST